MAPPTPAKVVIIALAVTGLFCLGLAPLLASVANPNHNAHRLNVNIADFDGGVVGQSLIAFLTAAKPAPGESLPHFVVRTNTSPRELISLVNRSHAWATIFVNEGATQALTDALTNPSTSLDYNPRAAITFAWDEARNNVVAAGRINGAINGLLGAFTPVVGPSILKRIAATNTINIDDVFATNPRLLTAPVAFTNHNLFPFDVPVMNQAQNLGNVLMCVFSFLTANVVLNVLGPDFASYPKVKRTLAIAGASSVFNAFISAAFATMVVGIADTNATGFEGHYNGGGQVWAQYWAVSWLLMVVFTFWFLAIGEGAGLPFLAPALVIVLLWNVVSLNTDLADPGFRFYWYGPMLYSSNLIKFVMFRSLESLVGRDVGLLIGWAVFDIIVFFVASLTKKTKPEVTATAQQAIRAKAETEL